ncbi:MAG: hypothetical protein ACREVL_06975, partial [Solimonas sp.]
MTLRNGRAGRLALMTAVVVGGLAACGGGGSQEPVGAPITGAVGTPDAEAWDAAQAYMDVVNDSPKFNECLTSNAGAEPWKCMRGPRSQSALGKAVADWLRGQFAATPGLTDAHLQPFTVPGFLPRAYDLRIDTDSGTVPVAAFPWYYRGTTPAAGVSGEIVDLGNGGLLPQLLAGSLQGKVAYLKIKLVLNAESGKAEDQLKQIEDKGAVAAIVATDAPANLIAAQNYDISNGRHNLPTLIVGKEDGERIAALKGRTAHVVVDANTADGTTNNVIARLPGADPTHIIVVGSPINGWLTVGGERAPGVGILVYLARYFADQARKNGPLPYTIDFIGTGGHEIYGVGVDRYLSCLDPAQIMAYIHMGSGLVYPGYRDGAGGEPEATGKLALGRTLAVSENTVLHGVADGPFDDPVLKPYYAFPP